VEISIFADFMVATRLRIAYVWHTHASIEYVWHTLARIEYGCKVTN
jgi:hypothetical protein